MDGLMEGMDVWRPFPTVFIPKPTLHPPPEEASHKTAIGCSVQLCLESPPAFLHFNVHGCSRSEVGVVKRGLRIRGEGAHQDGRLRGRGSRSFTDDAWGAEVTGVMGTG
eukprot:EG_transcript_24565